MFRVITLVVVVLLMAVAVATLDMSSHRQTGFVATHSHISLVFDED